MNILLLFSVFIVLPSIAECADNGIRPDKTIVSLPEGSSTTLSCTYDGSPYSLHWYVQKSGSRPEFLLLINEATNHVTKAEPPQPRLSAELHKKEKKVDLLISSATVSDSAVYYCAMENAGGGSKIIFGKGIKLITNPREPQEPDYYDLQIGNVNTCLATNFTAHYVDKNESRPEAVMFSHESYYSKVLWNRKCNSTKNEECSNETELDSDEKSRFLTLCIFGLRILFLKTILFNVLVTLKVWRS